MPSQKRNRTRSRNNRKMRKEDKTMKVVSSPTANPEVNLVQEPEFNLAECGFFICERRVSTQRLQVKGKHYLGVSSLIYLPKELAEKIRLTIVVDEGDSVWVPENEIRRPKGDKERFLDLLDYTMADYNTARGQVRDMVPIFYKETPEKDEMVKKYAQSRNAQ